MHSRSACAASLAYRLVRTHASASRRPRARARARVWVTRASWRACRRRRGRLSPSRRFPSHTRLVATPARLSRYARFPPRPVPRRSGRRPEGSSLRRAERRHGLSSHRRHAASHPFSVSLPPPPRPPFACLPTTARRLGAFSLLFLHFTAYPCGRFVAHDVPPSSTFRARCETGEIKGRRARGTRRSLSRAAPRRAAPCRALRRSAARLLSHGLAARRY